LPLLSDLATSRSSATKASTGVAGAEFRFAWLLPLESSTVSGRGDVRFAAEHGEIEQQRGTLEVDFEPVREGAALLGNDTGGSRRPFANCLRTRIGVFGKFDDFAAHAATAEHLGRHAEQQADEMSVVNVQIDEPGRPSLRDRNSSRPAADRK